MDSTIILSTARSGSKLLNRKLLGMSEVVRPQYWNSHNELAFEEFFIKHNLESLIKYDKVKYTVNPVINFDPIFHHRILEPRKYSEYCYYSTDLHTIRLAVKKCSIPVFNIHLFQINEKVSLMKRVKSPILFLIRKNNWQRMISQYLHNKQWIAPHIHLEDASPKMEKIDIEIPKDDLDQLITDSDYQVNLIKTFQRALKDQKNVKFIYYEDIENPSYWTDEIIDELEDFMKVKFGDRNYQPPFVKTRDMINLINVEDVMSKELIEKYYIEELA